MMVTFCSPKFNKCVPIQVTIKIAMVEAFCSSQFNDCLSEEFNFYCILLCVAFVANQIPNKFSTHYYKSSFVTLYSAASYIFKNLTLHPDVNCHQQLALALHIKTVLSLNRWTFIKQFMSLFD